MLSDHYVIIAFIDQLIKEKTGACFHLWRTCLCMHQDIAMTSLLLSSLEDLPLFNWMIMKPAPPWWNSPFFHLSLALEIKDFIFMTMTTVACSTVHNGFLIRFVSQNLIIGLSICWMLHWVANCAPECKQKLLSIWVSMYSFLHPAEYLL